jgi:phosphoribosyl-ATP pyrophosphohydrolase
MGIDDYVEWARKTGPEEITADVSGAQLALLGLSFIGDAGEVAEVVKNRLRDGVLDRGRLVYELGDVAYHWARLCAAAGVTPSELLDRSRRNVEARLAKRAAAS